MINEMSSFFHSACFLGKIHKFLFAPSKTKYVQPLQLIHSYMWVPSYGAPSNGYKYCIHYADAFSKSTLLYLLNMRQKPFKYSLTSKHKLNFNWAIQNQKSSI